MEEQLTLQDKVANFLYYFPKSTHIEIAEGVGLEERSCAGVLHKLKLKGLISFEVRSRTRLYFVSDDYQPVYALPVYVNKYTKQDIQKCENTIKSLCERGLLRRAKTELRRLSSMQDTARGVELVAMKSARI